MNRYFLVFALDWLAGLCCLAAGIILGWPELLAAGVIMWITGTYGIEYFHAKAKVRLQDLEQKTAELERNIGLKFDEAGFLLPGYHYLDEKTKTAKPCLPEMLTAHRNLARGGYVDPSAARAPRASGTATPITMGRQDPHTCEHQWFLSPDDHWFCPKCTSIDPPAAKYWKKDHSATHNGLPTNVVNLRDRNR